MTDAKVYAITGGAGGMGIATAKRFIDKGTLLLGDVAADRLDAVKKGLEAQGAAVETMVLDITDKDQVQAFADKAASLGSLGALIHTAGLSPALAPAEPIMAVNLVGTTLLLDAFYELAEEGSVVICVSSMAGHITPPNPALDALLANPLAPDFMEKIMGAIGDDRAAAYGLSKRAVIQMVEAQGAKWGKKRARIISISPGLIITPMGEAEKKNPQTDQMMRGMNPLERYGDADEIAAPIEFLCSEGAGYINGTDLRVDGGVTPVIKQASAA